MSISVSRPNLEEAQLMVKDWQAAVDNLLQNVQQWVTEAHDTDWHITISVSDVEEESLGRYQIPVMEINATKGRLVLEPVARYVIGASGRVDLYAWPSLYRVMLLRRGLADEWVIRTDSGINWPEPWGKQTFLSLTDSLLETT